MPEIKWVGAHPKNYQQGRNSKKVALFVVHATEGSLQSAANRFNNPASSVSAHYGIGKRGEIEQYVNTSDIAFHAGNWAINETSIGIEIEDIYDGSPPNDLQYKTIAWLISSLMKTYSLEPNEKTIQPHKNFRATLCPGDTDVNKVISLTQAYFKPKEEPVLAITKPNLILQNLSLTDALDILESVRRNKEVILKGDFKFNTNFESKGYVVKQ